MLRTLCAFGHTRFNNHFLRSFWAVVELVRHYSCLPCYSSRRLCVTFLFFSAYISCTHNTTQRNTRTQYDASLARVFLYQPCPANCNNFWKRVHIFEGQTIRILTIFECVFQFIKKLGCWFWELIEQAIMNHAWLSFIMLDFELNWSKYAIIFSKALRHTCKDSSTWNVPDE